MTMLMYPTFSPAESWASITIGLEAITVVTGMKSLPLATKELPLTPVPPRSDFRVLVRSPAEIRRTARPELGGMVVGVLAARGVGGRGVGGRGVGGRGVGARGRLRWQRDRRRRWD